MIKRKVRIKKVASCRFCIPGFKEKQEEELLYNEELITQLDADEDEFFKEVDEMVASRKKHPTTTTTTTKE